MRVYTVVYVRGTVSLARIANDYVLQAVMREDGKGGRERGGEAYT